jgi:putative DNA primase/helicase
VPDPKKTDVGIGSNCFAFRIFEEVGEELGVAEGIETAIAASILRGIPVWPCHCASIMANFVLPRVLNGRVRKLVIFQDNDPGKVRQDGSIYRAGQAAAAILAKRARQDGLKTLIVTSPKIGTDIADLVHSFA